MLMMFREDPGYDENKERRHGQRFLLRQQPGSGRWLVSFENGGISASQQEAPADVIISGTASDLHLFIMGRRTPDEMQIEGDKELAGAWGDLAGRF
jgi:predicted lipid carrier protein YhbT